ncbi:MAG: 2-oxoglutarate dehydrogenase E1 component, partial [Kistimonas sp.]|nr:2-oxoglutarate dehydrogenase E1 component [Kistimonas sp.]
MQDSLMRQMWQTGHLSGGNAAYVEELYNIWLQDPQGVPDAWRVFFSDLPPVGDPQERDRSHAEVRQYFLELGRRKPRLDKGSNAEYERKQAQVLRLVDAYRSYGFRRACTDPLGMEVPAAVPDLEPEHHGFTPADLAVAFKAEELLGDAAPVPLREILSALESIYCGPVGAEFMHIPDACQRRWFQNRLEAAGGKFASSNRSETQLLARLTAAEGLEKYLAAKYPGTKRFGLEGAESLIPLLDELIECSGAQGAEEIVIGMAHRGRLNVLVNILGKNPSDLFDEFEGKISLHACDASGDVKYHQGFSSNVMTSGGEVHLALAFNPSHLEIVSPVVQGSVRARQDRRKDRERCQVVPVAIHGDAAFAGQGVVTETFQLSQTRAYSSGGTVHVVVNNQVGFTTSRKEDARSTPYCTDVAKMLATPVLHVNGDDPAAVVFAAGIAVDYRREFGCDCVIDLVCYRRRGHNEADEPAFTQPLMYKQIRGQETTRTLYAKALVQAGVLTEAQEQAMATNYRAALNAGQHVVEALVAEPNTNLYVDWTPYLGHSWTASHDTRVPMETLLKLGERLCSVPDGFVLQRQIAKMMDERRSMVAGEVSLNWGMAELLAYATLLTDGYPVRMTGQDVARGTFSHRHAVLHSQEDGSTWMPLAHLGDDQSEVCLYDSVLSEEAVLAFEYGYATTRPRALVIWEAQFGDFANGAQVVIDQFITSGEAKWGRLCGLTMLLPHGYEGQGPEHSSARLERFL